MGENDKDKILIVDDEENIINFLKMGLEMEGFLVETASTGEQAVDKIKSFLPDIVILDVMLPGMSGFETCKIIKDSICTSIIMLTAREQVDDKVEGLNCGADDYMVKPFSFKELLARINARLRNSKNKASKVNDSINSSYKCYGNFSIDDKAHQITYKGSILQLSLTEYNLLELLILNNNIALSKSKMLDTVWGYDFYGDANIVQVYIKYLRNKIDDKKHEIIQTIRGVGYKLVV